MTIGCLADLDGIEINSATSMTALWTSSKFDLKTSYFFVA